MIEHKTKNGNVIAINIGKNDTQQLLADAYEMDFDSIVLLGWKDNQIMLAGSAVEDRIRLLGCLDELKNFMLNDWAPGE